MVGFNLLNPSARKTVLPHTQAHHIGTLCMFAVRRALSQPAALRELVAKLVADQLIPPGSINAESPLDFLTDPGVASEIPEAAYRSVRACVISSKMSIVSPEISDDFA
jgi:hypothetical protein